MNRSSVAISAIPNSLSIHTRCVRVCASNKINDILIPWPRGNTDSRPLIVSTVLTDLMRPHRSRIGNLFENFIVLCSIVSRYYMLNAHRSSAICVNMWKKCLYIISVVTTGCTVARILLSCRCVKLLYKDHIFHVRQRQPGSPTNKREREKQTHRHKAISIRVHTRWIHGCETACTYTRTHISAVNNNSCIQSVWVQRNDICIQKINIIYRLFTPLGEKALVLKMNILCARKTGPCAIAIRRRRRRYRASCSPDSVCLCVCPFRKGRCV